jgi:hypothetical protein
MNEVVRKPRYVLAAEACKYGSMSRRQLHRLIRSGQIDARKGGHRTTWIDLDSIDRYFESLPKLKSEPHG